ncbi:MAG: hypothetical protein WD772_04870 [Pseudohongiellaceae bacterium]
MSPISNYGEFLNTSDPATRSRFRQLKIILIVLIPILLIPVVGILQKLGMDSAARELSLAVTESVLAGNDPALLLQSVSRELDSQMSEDNWRRYVDLLRRLGRLELLESVTGNTNVPLLPFLGDEFTARYVIITKSENSAATANVSLRYEDGQWRITAFTVSSPLTDE